MESVDVVVGVDSEVLSHLDEAWDICCEIPAVAQETGLEGFPDCKAGRAEWVAWRSCPCPESPNYVLLCDPCRNTYASWQSQYAFLVCAWCGNEGEMGLITPLNRAA